MLKSDKPPYYKNKKETAVITESLIESSTVENIPTVESSTVESSTVESSTVESSTVESSTVESSTVESSKVEDDVQNSKDYCSVVKKIKKDNVTVENIGEIMLCQIPGISSVTAIAILSKFKNFPDLITEMKKDPTCLNSISYITSNGQSRKISKACIASIIKFLIV
jgi:hypothetical protein